MLNMSMIEEVANHVFEIMDICGLDLKDPHLKNTPERVAGMYSEVFSSVGKDPHLEDKLATQFPNDENYNQMISIDNIPFSSFCAHHLVPFSGKAWVVYIPKDSLLGLSKATRILRFFGSKPQVQERLTSEVGNFLKEVLKPKGLMVLMRGIHECTRCRGVKNQSSSGMTTSFVDGVIANEPSTKEEALMLISMTKER